MAVDEIEDAIDEEIAQPEYEVYDIVDLDDIKVRTHTELDVNYAGYIDAMKEDESFTTLSTSRMMQADSEHLTHSGFVGSAAEYAALIAVNEPNGMIYSVNSQYFACARIGDDIKYHATVKHSEGRKRDVIVIGKIEAIKIYEAHIIVVIPEYHPLKIKLLEVAGAND